MNRKPLEYEKAKVIPFVESDLFEGSPRARFAIARLAVGSLVTQGRQDEFDGALKLRSNVYLDKGFVTPDDLDDNGTELDSDDARAVHFAAFERTTTPSVARVVANMRLVVRGPGEPPLPMEAHYPEVFADRQTAVGSTEVSRLISQHEDASVQNALTWSMFIAGLRHVEEYQLGPVYGLIEPRFTRSLAAQGVPVAALSDARFIDAIKARKQPVQINATGLSAVVDRRGDFGIDLEASDVSYVEVPTEMPLVTGYADEKEKV